jgi:hypothetical protein
MSIETSMAYQSTPPSSTRRSNDDCVAAGSKRQKVTIALMNAGQGRPNVMGSDLVSLYLILLKWFDSRYLRSIHPARPVTLHP